MLLCVLIPFILFLNIGGQEVITLKNETHVVCIYHNKSDVVYVEPVQEQIEKENDLIESGNFWDDWSLQNSTSTLIAPVEDRRWQEFKIEHTKNINFSFETSLSLWLYEPQDIQIFLDDDFVRRKGRSEWTSFFLYKKDDVSKCLENNEEFRTFLGSPSKITMEIDKPNYWKYGQHKVRVANTISREPTNLNFSPKSCLMLYVYLCEYCFLDVSIEDEQISIDGTINTNKDFYTSHEVELKEVSKVSLRRYTNNDNSQGFWAVDLRHCSSLNSNHVKFETEILNITDKENITCKILKSPESTRTRNRDICNCNQTGVFGSDCNISCKELFGPNQEQCQDYKVRDSNSTWQNISTTCLRQEKVEELGSAHFQVPYNIGFFITGIVIAFLISSVVALVFRNNFFKRNRAKEQQIVEHIQVVLSRDNEQVSGEFCNEKTDLLARAIMNFGVTIVENDPEDVIAKIWKDTNNSDENSKTLWQTGTVPLIIKLNDLNREVVESSINLLKIHKKIEHVVLIGKNSEEFNLKMEKWDQLKNFSHVINKHKDKEWYTQIIKSFNVSFQGRGNLSLEDLLKLDKSVAEVISLQHLIEMAHNERLLIGNEITFPELEKDTKEHKRKSEFKENLTVFYGSSSSQRSTLLHKLIMECPKMSLVFYIHFKSLISILKENPNEDKDVLNTFLNNNNNDPLVLKIKEIMTQNQKMEIFLDGFKKSDTKQYEQIKKYLKQWSGEGIRIWISSQENLREDLHNFSNVEHVDVVRELKRQNKTHDSEIKKIDIDTDIATCQKMFEKLEKRSPDSLKNYEILALKACLEDAEFKVLNLKTKDEESFLKKILDQGQTEVIKKNGQNNKPIFVYQKFAEYLACNWLRKNKEKINMLPLLSKKYYHLRRTLDTMMAKDKPLHLAVINQDFNEFEKHLKEKKFDDKDEGGRTALHLLCSYGKQYSFQENETCSEEHETTNFIKMVKSFLQVCTNNNEIDDFFSLNYVQYTVRASCLYPLEEILKKKLCDFKEVMDAARDEGWNIDQFYILSAKLGYITLITEIVNDQPQLVEETVCGHSLLYYAATGCNSDLNNSAVTRRKAECAKLLIEKNSEGASFLSTVQYSGGNTILHEVSRNKNKNNILIALAIKNDIDVNIANDKGETVLHFASAKGAISDVENILQFNDERKEVLDKSGNNVLHWACKSKKDNTEMINNWIEEGFDINCKNHHDQTPLYFACEEGSVENVTFLEKRNADFSIVDESGNTLLHAALKSKQDNPEIIKIILEKDVDLNALNEEGQTALDLARSNGNERIQKILTNREQ